MPLDDYLVGVAYLAATVGSAVLAAAVVTRRRLAHLVGAPRLLAFSLLAIAAILLAHVVPAALGVLSRETALGVALLTAAACAWRVPRAAARAPSPAPPAAAPSGRVSWTIAGLAASAVAGHALVFGWESARSALGAYDALTFHLPGVARWIQSGSIWQIDQFVPHWSFGTYPHNGNLLQLAAVLPWENDAFVRFVSYPLLGLAGVAVYVLAAELRAPRASAVLMAALLLSVPVATLPALAEGQVDTLMVAAFASGLVFLTRHFRTGERADLLLGGLGLGLAFGTKWYGLPMVTVVLAVWLVANRVAGRPVVRPALALLAVIACAGGLWLVRNAVETGNPVFPAEVATLGVTLFESPGDSFHERLGHTIAEYLDQPRVLDRYVAPGLEDAWQWPGLILAAAPLLTLGLLLVRRRRPSGPLRDEPAVAVVAILAALLMVAYALTPNSATGYENEPFAIGAAARYAIPAFVPAAAVAAWALGVMGRARVPLEALAALAAADGLARVFDLPAEKVVLGMALAAGVAAVVAVVRAHRWLRPLALAGVAAGLGLAVAVGHDIQKDFNRDRYRGVDPAFDWVAANAPSGRRIGLAGTWSDRGPAPPLPMLGPRYGNHVAYVGPFKRGMLRTYREPGPFVERLRRDRFDFLLVGLGGPPPRPAREEGWARSAGFAPVARSDRFALYRRQGGG